LLAKPGLLLHLEGAGLFAATLYFYHLLGFSWWMFLLLFLWPDLFMVGYIWNAKIGSALYNLAHTEVLAVALTIFSLSTHRPQGLAFSLIWLAHIGFDRTLGYGLKYPTTFKDTHLQRVN
jgi:hypothetical protein